jgi:hypothetical protein
MYLCRAPCEGNVSRRELPRDGPWGDRREDLFVKEVDRQDLVKTLAEAREKTGWEVHAYCLMRNHFQVGAASPGARTNGEAK